MKLALLACALSSCAWCSAAERTTQSSAVIHASAHDLWQTFQTAEGIQKAWGVPKAEVDFRMGGAIRTSYDPNATLGDDSTITNEILAYEPERVLVLRSIAPKAAPDFIKTICETGWTVLRLDPLTPNSTEVTVTGMGYKDGELYDKAFDFFQQGNAQTLALMQTAFESKERRAGIAAVGTALKSMAGTWEFSQQTPEGATFRGRTTIVPLFGGNVLFATGYLGNEKTLAQHSHATIAKDPRTDEWMFWNFADDGSFTLGPCRMEGTNKLVVDWNTHMKDGKRIDFRVEYTFIDPDNFDLIVQGPAEANGTRGTIAKVHYKRVPGDAAATPIPPK